MVIANPYLQTEDDAHRAASWRRRPNVRTTAFRHNRRSGAVQR